jgi:hypothetical protein
MRFVDLMLALPVFFVILFMSSIITPRMTVFTLCVMIGFSQWMEVARLVRAVVISTKQHEFVDAARVLGYTDRRILVRHLLPHTLAPVLVAVTLGIAQAIVIESALSFLGFGVQPPTPSWGAMLQNVDRCLSRCHDLCDSCVLQRLCRLPGRCIQPRRVQKHLISEHLRRLGLILTRVVLYSSLRIINLSHYSTLSCAHLWCVGELDAE